MLSATLTFPLKRLCDTPIWEISWISYQVFDALFTQPSDHLKYVGFIIWCTGTHCKHSFCPFLSPIAKFLHRNCRVTNQPNEWSLRRCRRPYCTKTRVMCDTVCSSHPNSKNDQVLISSWGVVWGWRPYGSRGGNHTTSKRELWELMWII